PEKYVKRSFIKATRGPSIIQDIVYMTPPTPNKGHFFGKSVKVAVCLLQF
ncbi:hypothetical protein STEG23_029189, partial [Scotinomys teguina]